MSRRHSWMTRGAGPSAAKVVEAEVEPAAPALPEVAVPGRVFRSVPLAADPLGGAPVEQTVVAALRRRSGTGRPLPDQIGHRLADHLGHDLSAVRVHDDPEANRISASLQASAFTHGNDLYFANGAYRPGTDRGLHTLAHELGHVVAQRSGLDSGRSGPLEVGRADDPAERMADRTAVSALAALRRSAAPESSVGPGGTAGPGTPVRRLPASLRREVYPDKGLKKFALDTDDPATFVAEVRRLKLSGRPDADTVIKAIVDWLRPTYGQLADSCQDIWIASVKQLRAADRPATAPKVTKGKSAGQREHEKREQQRAKNQAQRDQAYDAERAAADAAAATSEAAEQATNDVHAPVYWARILQDPVNTPHGADLDFLVTKKYLTLADAHRCFLSSYEKAGNVRTRNRFGLSRELVPGPVLSQARPAAPTLVVHLHCNGNGSVRSAGIKFRNTERQPGNNLLLTFAKSEFLRAPGITGDNVESEVGAFN